MFTSLLSAEQLIVADSPALYHVGRLVSFEVASVNFPTMLEEDRIAPYNFSKAWPCIRAQLTQRIPYKRWHNLDCPACPVASLWGIFSKATRPGGVFSNLSRSIWKPLEIWTAYRQYRVVAYPLSTNFASKMSIASSKDNVVATPCLFLCQRNN